MSNRFSNFVYSIRETLGLKNPFIFRSHGGKILLLNMGTNNLINNDSNSINENIHETKDEEDDEKSDQEDDEYEY